MRGPDDPSRRRLLAAALAWGATGVWGRGRWAAAEPAPAARLRERRLVLVAPRDALPAERARSVEQAVRLALADGAATLGHPAGALDVVHLPNDGPGGAASAARLAHVGAGARDGRAAAVLAITSPSVLGWLSHRAASRRAAATAPEDGAPWVLLPASAAGSVAPLPRGVLQVGRDDLAVAGAVAGWLAGQPGGTLVLSDATPRSARLERALRARDSGHAEWAVAPASVPSPDALEARLRGAGAARLLLNTSPRTASAWVPALARLLARAAPTVVASQWDDATLTRSEFDALAGLVWVTTWHPSLGGSERNWARRHRALTGVIPGDAEAAAYSAALAAVTTAPAPLAAAEVRDVFVPSARFGRDGCLPHATQVRRRRAGVDEFGWPNQQLLAVASPAQAFADRRTGDVALRP